MPIARFQMPDGRIARFEVPEGTSPEEAQQMMEAAIAGGAANAAPAAKPKGGFMPALKANFANLKGDLAGLAGRTGLMSIPDAEKYQQEQAQVAKNTFKPTDKGWLDDPITKVKELAGGSAAYMAAPVLAGGAAAVAGAPALVGAGVAGLTSMAQFTGSNITDQQATGKKLADTNLQNAALAAGPQALLDIIGFKMIPGIRTVFKAAGKEITEEAAARLAQQTLRQKAAEYAAATGKAMTGEGLTEAAQQVFSRMQAGLNLKDPEAMKEYWDSFVGGAVLGGTIAPVGHMRERGQQQTQAQAAIAAKNEAAAKAAAETQAAQEAQVAAEKQKPEYLKSLDANYQQMLKDATAEKAAIGPKPDKNADPSAFMAWQAAQKAHGEKFGAPEYAALTNEHASRRGEIDALKAQEAAQVAQADQASQTAMEAGADQMDTRTPADTGPSTPNAQPDLFAEGQTAPSGTQPGAPAEPVPVEQQLQTASQALMDHENAMNALRDKAKAAVTSGDMDAVMRHSTQANELTKQLKPLQDAVATLRGQHKPSVEADIAGIQKKLVAAAEAGDTEKLAKLAAKIKELRAGMSGQKDVVEGTMQNAARDAALANEMASGREQAAATTAKIGAETGALQRIADKAGQPSEAAAVKNLQAKEDRDSPAVHPVQQEPLQGEAETDGTRSDAAATQAVGKLTDTLVDPAVAAREQQIRELKREQAQHKSIGREDLAAEVQTRITALESKGRVNPHDADTVSRIDTLHRELEQAKAAVEHARVTRNATDTEANNLKARQIADQLANIQKEPGSFAGRLVKAKNDVSATLTAFFDAAHEIHTSGMSQRLRDKHADLQAKLRDMNRPPATQGEVAVHAAKRGEIERQMAALQRQLGAVNTETPTRKLEVMARQAVSKYVRSAFREENIRREARQQKPLTGPERDAFTRKVHAQAEAMLTRVKADRGGDYMEEHVVQPAQMRSGKVVKNAVTEWRDTRPLEERPLAKFGAARAVEEEVFHKERAESLQSKQKPQRVEGDGIKRQWQAQEEKKRADERGDNFKTLTGQQRRRAEYLRVQMSRIDGPEIQPLQDALAKHPTNQVMDVIEPLLHEARTGRMPGEADLARLREAVALEKEVATDNTKGEQRDLFAPQTAIMEQARIEDKQQVNNDKAEALPATFKNLEEAGAVAKEHTRLDEANTKLEQEKQRSKDDETALKGEQARMATAFERTTPARFANAPEVKAGRAAADEQAKLTAEIHDQLEGFVAAESTPTWFSKLAEQLSTLRTQLQAFKAGRPFAEMGRMQKRDIPELLEKDDKIFKRQDSADIIFQLANYNKFVDDTNAFLAKHKGTDSAEYKRLLGEIENVQRAIHNLPSDTELVAARRTVEDQRKALTTLLAMPEPKKPAGQAARAKNIETTRAALDMAEGILRLKETTPRLTPDVEGRRARLALAAEDGAKVRAESVAEAAKRRADMDAAVEERMRLEEATHRLSKLPATRVSSDAETQYGALLRSGLRKEASGIEAKLSTIDSILRDPAYFDKAEQKIKDAQAGGTAAYRIDKMKRQLADARSLEATEAGRAKWEKLLQKSNTTYEQLDSLLPKKVERLNEEVTSEKDDVLQPATPTKAQQKRIDAAVAAAEKQNERALAKGRPQTVRSTAISHNKVSTVRGEKTITTSQAVRAANTDQATHDARIHAAEARVAHIEGLQEKNAAALAAAKGREAKAKYEGFEARLDKAHADASAQLARAQELAGRDIVDDEMANKFSERKSTLVSQVAQEAAHDGRILDVVADIAQNGSTPEMKAAAARLQPLLMRTKLVVDADVNIGGESVAGKYDPVTNTITMHPDALTEEDIIHEMTHAATVRALRADVASLTTSQREARAGLESMWAGVQNHPDFAKEHGAKDVHEFASEVYSNAEFRAKLDALGKPLSLLERFKNLVRKLLGFPSTPGGKAKDMVDRILQPSQRLRAPAMPSVFRAVAYTSEAAKFGRDIAPHVSTLEKVKANKGTLALALEQKVVDFRAALRRVSDLGNAVTGDQVKYSVLLADKGLNNMQSVAEQGAMAVSRDAAGILMTTAGHSSSAKDIMNAVSKLPGASSAEKLDMAQGYLTAKRAEQVGYDTLDFADPVGAAKRGAAVIKEVESNPALKAAMAEVQRHYQSLNHGLVKFLEQTEALPKDVTDKMLADKNYIPFYRDNGDLILPDGGFASVGDIRNMPFLHALNQGDAKLMPFEQSLFKNIATLTNMGMQNLAARHTAYHLQGLGAGPGVMKIARGDGPAVNDGRVIRFNQKPAPGETGAEAGKRHIIIDTKGTAAEHIPNDLLAQAVAGTYGTVPTFLKVGAWASDILRSGVTRMPTYLVSQLFKDPMNASMLGNLKADPFRATAKTMANFMEHLTSSSAEDRLLTAHGVLHSNIFSGGESDIKKVAMQIAGGNQSKYRQTLAALDKMAMSADAATRIQGYRDVIAAGGSEARAVIHAMEMQNFNKRGASMSMQTISRLVPFFNAQIQGMNVILKSAQGKMPSSQRLAAKEAFFNRAIGLTAMAVMYCAAMEDDEDWKRLTLHTKMANIPIPGLTIAGQQVHIPTPFETGMLFWSLPVAFMHALQENFSEADWKDVQKVLLNQVPGNGSVMPQLFKGYIDVSRNYNSFFGSPIETAGMQTKATTERFNKSTPELAKAMSRQLVDLGVDLSPVQIDYLANAYLGQLPHMVGMLTNSLFETKSQTKDVGEEAEGEPKDNPLLARFVNRASESRNVNAAYAAAKEAMKTKGTVDSMRADGRGEEAMAYAKEQIAKYGRMETAGKFTQQMGFYKRQEAKIRENASMDAEEKQAALEALYKSRDKAAGDYLRAIGQEQ